MTTAGAGKRRSAGETRSGKEPPDGPELPIDWGPLREEVLRVLDGRGMLARTERAIGSASAADAVQDVIAKLYTCFEAGEEPRTHDELKALAELAARRRLAYWSRRERKRARSLESHGATLSTLDLFEVICARDENAKLLTRVSEEIGSDPEAKLLWISVVDRGIGFSESRLLAEIIGCETVHITNIKRRLVRVARNILKMLTSSGPGGGGQ